MSEIELYRMAQMKCERCDNINILEVECLTRVEVGSRVESRCPTCRKYGKNIVLAMLMLFLFASFSWGACYERVLTDNFNCSQYYTCFCNTGSCDDGHGQGLGTCYGSIVNNQLVCSSNVSVGRWCVGRNQVQIGQPYCISEYQGGLRVLECTTEAEADSANCVLNPTDPSCAVESDTTLFGCSDNASGNGALYRLACQALNGAVVSCNGKTNVDIATDGQLVRQLDGTCAQNGFNTGIVGGATPQDSVPKSANADCFAVIGSKCHMKDKVSGNTFTCDCDGSCNYALNALMAGNANCTNPYPQPSGDSLVLPQSSASSPESSEGGSSGTSGSSSAEGGGNSSDFEYDYTEVLENIRANTQYNGTMLDGIRNNTATANALLQAIVNKDWNPTINVGSPNVNVAGDTNIINVEVTGDTARAGAEILGFLTDTAGIGGYADQFESDRALWESVADSVKNAVRLFLDSMNTLDTSWAKHSEDVDSALSSNLVTFRAYMDTIRNSPFNDTLDAWANALSNTGPITGAGSNSCPAVLTRGYTLTIGQVTVQTEGLGKYLCTPIAGQSLTLWALARTMLRFMVAFGCMLWIYKAVTGTETNEEGE